MTTREQRVIQAFVDCVAWGRFTRAYATVLVEDDARYGWMSAEAKEALYTALDEAEAMPDEEDVYLSESDEAEDALEAGPEAFEE